MQLRRESGKVSITEGGQGSDSYSHRHKYIKLGKRKLTTSLGNMEAIRELGENNFTGVVEGMSEYSDLKRTWEVRKDRSLLS